MKLKLEEDYIQNGDTFFTRSCSPLGLIIQFATGLGKPTHVGKIMRGQKGRLFVVEMLMNFKKDGDLKCRPLSFYRKKSRFWRKLIAIKRAPEFIFPDTRTKFLAELKKYTAKEPSYDFSELIFKDKDKNKLICSRFVYEIDKACGVDFKAYTEHFEQRVTPADLFDCDVYYKVECVLADYCQRNNINLVHLRARLIRCETIAGNFRERPYWDVCHFTIGYGTTMSIKHWGRWIKSPKKFKITKVEAEAELDKYIYVCMRQLFKLLGKNIVQLNHVRREALIDMIFNMGISRFKKFKKTIFALKRPIIDWQEVAMHVKDSSYYRKPNLIDREENVVRELLTGIYVTK